MSVTVWSGAVERNESDLPQLPVIQSRARARVANVPVARPFEVQGAFSVPGTVDNKMDGTATEDMDYTYRLRCEKGEKYSDYSNEMMANPNTCRRGRRLRRAFFPLARVCGLRLGRVCA